MLRRLVMAVAFLFAVSLSVAALEVPFLSGRVQDDAGILTPEAKSRIGASLEALEKETGAQVVVLSVPSLEGDPIGDLSMRVVETWKLGREGVDDGVLLLVARDDRKIRIEVGYGLEGVLTDAAGGRVIDQLMTPRFKEGDFDGGIEAATVAISGAIRGQEGAIPPEAAFGTSEEAGGLWFYFAFFAFVVSPFANLAARARGSAGWVLYLFLIPFFFFFSLVLGLPIALTVVALYIAVVGLMRFFLPERLRLDFGTRHSGGSGGMGRRSGGGWSGGGGFSGGGGSSGGFSGGGGSFGGGGASGGW